MAPTGILAEQHYKSLKRLLATPSTVEAEDGMLYPALLDESQICLIVGATPEVEKQQARENLANGTIKVVVGTHALIEDR
jgi:ATP-dependent DNA helicase RecG